MTTPESLVKAGQFIATCIALEHVELDTQEGRLMIRAIASMIADAADENGFDTDKTVEDICSITANESMGGGNFAVRPPKPDFKPRLQAAVDALLGVPIK